MVGALADVRQAIGRLDDLPRPAMRQLAATQERFDLVLVKLGLISEADLCAAYAKYCGIPLLAPEHVPDKPVLPERLQLPFLKASSILPIRQDEESLLIATADPFLRDAPILPER
jgi:general secretion pathway protein E